MPAPERTSQMLPSADQVRPADPEPAPAKEAATEEPSAPAAVSTPVSATPEQNTAGSEVPSTPQQSTSDSDQREQSNSSKRLSKHFSLDGAKAGILGTAAVLSSSFSRSFNRRTSATPEPDAGLVPPTIPQKDPGRFSFRAFSESLFDSGRTANTPEAETEQKASAPTTDHDMSTKPDQMYQPGIPEQKDVCTIDAPDERLADPAVHVTQPRVPEAPKPYTVPGTEPDFARPDFESPAKQTETYPYLQAEIPLHSAPEPEREPELAAYPEPQHEPVLESRSESQYNPQAPLWQQHTKPESQEPRPQRQWSAGPQWQEPQYPLQSQLQRPQAWEPEVLPKEQPTRSQVSQMPSQAQPFTPKAEPITSKIEPFTPDTQRFTPQAQPVTPQAETVIPQTQTFIPQSRPYMPRAQPSVPRTQPHMYQAQPSTPQALSYIPQSQPITPKAQPITTEAQSFTTQTEPVTNQVEPHIPQAEPFVAQAHPLPAQEQPYIPEAQPTDSQYETVPELQQPINLQSSMPNERAENATEVRSSLSSQYSAQSAEDTPEGVRSSKTYFPETIAEYMYQMSAHGHVMIPSTTGHSNAEEEEPETSPEPNHSAFEPMYDNYYEPPRQETILEDPAAEAAAEAAGDETAQNDIAQHKEPAVNMPDTSLSTATTPRKAYTPLVKEAPLPPLPPPTSHSLPATPRGYESSRNLPADTTLPP